MFVPSIRQIPKIPPFLNAANVVSLQSVVAEEVMAGTGLDVTVAKNIAGYATTPDPNKVEPTRMIEFFRSKLPPDWLMSHEQYIMDRYGWSLLEAQQPLRTQMHPNAHPLSITPERRLYVFAANFFGCHLDAFLGTVSQELHTSILLNDTEEDNFIGCIDGVTHVTQRRDAFMRCVEYTFRHHRWWSPLVMQSLLGHPETVFKVLVGYGYTVATGPAVGHIVVYHTSTEVFHYGRVVLVDPSGEVTVLSKKGIHPVSRHRVDIAIYGDRVLYLNPPREA